jgi:uncharacterized small protein (DUF1192 family)
VRKTGFQVEVSQDLVLLDKIKNCKSGVSWEQDLKSLNNRIAFWNWALEKAKVDEHKKLISVHKKLVTECIGYVQNEIALVKAQRASKAEKSKLTREKIKARGIVNKIKQQKNVPDYVSKYPTLGEKFKDTFIFLNQLIKHSNNSNK